jgi:hypothetical protein
MPDYQCLHCGKPAELGHNCTGMPFRIGPALNSIAAAGVRQEVLKRKGFHEDSNVDGVFYRHPMYGLIAMYPGGTYRTAYAETDLGLDAYLQSLADSSYTDIGSPEPYQTRCDACGEIGSFFPLENFPFPHKIDCPQKR